MTKLDFQRPKQVVLDLSTSKITARGLTEYKHFCHTTEKDLFLYYFVARYPGACCPRRVKISAACVACHAA